MNVAGNVREYRLRAGLTQKELANLVCVAQSMICQIERGTKIPTVLLADEIAQALGCTVDELLRDADERKTG